MLWVVEVLSRRQLISAVLQSSAMVTVSTIARGASPPQLLSSEQCGTLNAIGERIVPGSSAAHCERVIDLVMTLEPVEVRDQLVRSIAAFDTKTQREYSKSFAGASPEQQDAVVAIMAKETDKDSPFSVVKEWIADTYWSSRDGLHDLGWKGQIAWPKAQVCQGQSS